MILLFYKIFPVNRSQSVTFEASEKTVTELIHKRYLTGTSENRYHCGCPQIPTKQKNIYLLDSSISRQVDFEVHENCGLNKCINREIMPWSKMERSLQRNYNLLLNDFSGSNCMYIPELANCDTSLFAFGVSSWNGEFTTTLGPHEEMVSMQSICKFVLYLYCAQKHGLTSVNEKISCEPVAYNSLEVNKEGKCFHASQNLAALVLSGMVLEKCNNKNDDALKEVYNFVEQFAQLDEPLEFCTTTYQSELATAFRNKAIVEEAKRIKLMPSTTSSSQALKLYLKLCSTKVSTAILLQIGKAFATNNDLSPIQLSAGVRQATILQMQTGGAYGQSQQIWNASTAVTKTGVSGAVIAFQPDKTVMAGISTPLNEFCNSFRVIEMIKRIGNDYPELHIFNM